MSFPSEVELNSLVEVKIPGPNVMKYSPSNINDYCCGSFALIERDIKAVLSQECASIVLNALSGLKIMESFKAREELINYKKVAYHLHQQGTSMERQLAQLITFFWGEEKEMKIALSSPETQNKFKESGNTSESSQYLDSDDVVRGAHGKYFVTSLRNMELSDGRMQCAGALTASQDARVLGKHVCCIARHHSKPLPKDLGSNILKGLKSMKIIQEAKSLSGYSPRLGIETDITTITHSSETTSSWLQDFLDTFLLTEHDVQSIESSNLYTSSTVSVIPDIDAAFTKKTLQEDSPTHLQPAAASSWPVHIRRFVVAVVVCRGAWKALRMVDEMHNVCHQLQQCINLAELELQRLEALPSYKVIMEALEKKTQHSAHNQLHNQKQDILENTRFTFEDMSTTAADLVSTSLLHRRSINLLKGCLPQLKDAKFWISKILSQADENAMKMKDYNTNQIIKKGNDFLLPRAIFSEKLFVAGENNKIKKYSHSRQRSENARYLSSGKLSEIKNQANEYIGASGGDTSAGDNGGNDDGGGGGGGSSSSGDYHGTIDESEFDIMSPTICAPAGFDGGLKFYELLQSVILKYRPCMQKVLAEKGWPDHIAERRGLKKSVKACSQLQIDNDALGSLSAKTIESTNDAAEICQGRGGELVDQEIAPRPMNKVCQICDNQFSKLWVHRGVCCECESAAREGKIIKPCRDTAKKPVCSSNIERSSGFAAGRQGWCPFNARCKSDWWCPHDRKCVVCDAHSCSACRLYRGGAEVVLALARQLNSCDHQEESEETNSSSTLESPSDFPLKKRVKPSVVNDKQPFLSATCTGTRLGLIAFDFDRTLATTRSGGKPLHGVHTLDPELMNVLWEFQHRCCVVTRNRYNEDIVEFLRLSGAPDNIPVHSLPKKFSKATAETFKSTVEAKLEKVIIVDDTIAELVTKDMVSNPLIHRVLFVRALL